MVGSFQDKSGFEQGFVYKFTPGASSPDPASQGVLSFFTYPESGETHVTGVNKQGQIVGWAYVHKAGVGNVSFIATPVAEPTAAAPAP